MRRGIGSEISLLTADGRLLFSTRIARLFAYGFLSVVLVLYLAQAGLSEAQIGLLLTLTLVGDTAISLWITTNADRLGRRKMLLVGAGMMVFAGVVFALTDNYFLLILAATIGTISPSGYEVGPFLPVEQAALTQIIPANKRTHFFAWYNLAGSFATAFGALAAGWLVQIMQNAGRPVLESYRSIVLVYAAMGLVLGFLFSRLSHAAEARVNASEINPVLTPTTRFGLHRSFEAVMKLASLFALDAFAGGFVIQSILAYWFHLRFGIDAGILGSIFFAANLLAGISALLAARVAARFGLINTMVFTHIPSNVLLMLVPLAPNLNLAVGLLLLRFSISQMDVPTRQSYIMAVVETDERSAAAGITGIARTIGASLSPALAAPLLANVTLMSLPFFLSGSLKIIYDLSLYRAFRGLKPPEEMRQSPGAIT